MSQQLDSEVTRILSSDTSKTLLSQLRSYTSTEATIEEELLLKTAQINKLQTILRSEIDNIHSIVEVNNRLKLDNEALRKELALAKEQSKSLEDLLRQSQDNNKQYIQNVRELQQMNFQLQLEKRVKTTVKSTSEQQVQTAELPFQKSLPSTHRSTTTDLQGPQTTHSQLRIKQLEEMVSQLKYQKTELLFKLKSGQSPHLESLHSEHNQSDSASDQQQKITVKSTAEIIHHLCLEELQEVKFRGQLFNGLKEGKGICYYEDDVQYEGNFKEGKRNGLGTLYAYGQTIYRGFWKEGVISGKGVMKMLEGEIESYEGQFREGHLDGYGCMKLKSGKKIMGFWKGGRLQGNCFESVGGVKRYIEPQLIPCY